MNTVPAKYGARFYRECLSNQGKYIYDKIDDQLSRRDYSGKITLIIQHPESAASDCFAAYQALRDDRPEYFFLGYHSEFISQGLLATFKYHILYSTENIERIKLQLRKYIYQVVRGTAYLPLLEQEIIVYERIARRIKYTNNDDARDHNIVGPILMSSGVCEGQNSLLMLSFRRLSIPCIKVYGSTIKDSLHCWTIAWINRSPVHCDVTWENRENDCLFFDYLNLSDNQISADHFSFKKDNTPRCQNEMFNYYQQNDLVANSYNELRIKLKKNTLIHQSNILIHMNYKPLHDDYMKEIQRALNAERIYGKYIINYHPVMNNLMLRKV